MGPFTTGKRLTYPTWRYKSRHGYAKAKEKQILTAVHVINKVFNGSAWLPKDVREAIEVASAKLDFAYDKSVKFTERVKPK